MLEQRDGKPERDAELAEARRRGFVAGRITVQACSKALRLRIEVRRAGARRHALDVLEELLHLVRIAQIERRLDPFDDGLLHGLLGDAQRAAGLYRRLGVDERLAQLPLGAAHRTA